jgi:hypothetical protein
LNPSPNPTPDAPISPSSSAPSDLDLLRRFEPVLHFTQGEQFFPTDVDRYVRKCSLWAHYPDGRDEQLVKEGDLSLDRLAEPRPAQFGTVHYLRFIENLSLGETAQVLTDQLRLRRLLGNRFHPGIGRLARGGLLPRIMDALFSISFLLRGRVPAATAAAAELDYFHMRAEKEQYVYYGRVARQSGWTVLQYWFFYSYDSWRSGFDGVNDHEADWEMISLYLYEDDGELRPEWAMYASHDFHGDELRRRWDDRSQLDLEDGHPVVYIGAGSHASYFRPGEYQAEVDLDLPRWVQMVRRFWNRLWTGVLGQQPADPFRIPFVDYARGDGMKVGPGHHRTWSPVLIGRHTPWVGDYRGLWGLFARDPISGENAPAGPMYNRDGTPRASWYDPLGFSGLDKVPPPPDAMRVLEQNCTDVANRQTQLKGLIPAKAAEMQALGMKLKGMEGNPHLAGLYAAMQKRSVALADEVRGLRREYLENTAVLESLTGQLDRRRMGRPDDPESHIRHLIMPVQTTRMRFDRLAEPWAAVSLSVLLFGVVALLLLAPRQLVFGLAAITLLIMLAESILRGAFIQTIGELTALLAIIAGIILVVHFWFWLLIAALVGAATFLLFQRLRELTG